MASRRNEVAGVVYGNEELPAFVDSYRVNSQMSINSINGANFTSSAGRLIHSIYDTLDELAET